MKDHHQQTHVTLQSRGVKCTRSRSSDLTDLLKSHYLFKAKRLAKKIPETKKCLREFLTLFDKESEFKKLSFR